MYGGNRGGENYVVYPMSEKFFFFQDRNGMINEDKKGQWYVGVMGNIKIESDDGTEMMYVAPDEFVKIPDDEPDEFYKYYTYDQNTGSMVVYKKVTNVCKYIYKFTYGDTTEGKEGEFEGESNTSYPTQCIDIQDNTNASQYAVTIELLMSLLTTSQSSEYVDRFMDYAIENTKLTIKAYQLDHKEIYYDIRTFNVNPIIYELYDFNSCNNFFAYKELVYNRKLKDGEHSSKLGGSVVELPGLADLQYEGPVDPEKGNPVAVDKLADCLKLAYEKPQDDKIGEVEERVERTCDETTWAFYVDQIQTWYGTITYNGLGKIKKYYCSTDGVNVCDVLSSRYRDFDPYTSSLDGFDYEMCDNETKTYVMVNSDLSSFFFAEDESWDKWDDTFRLEEEDDIYDDVLNFSKLNGENYEDKSCFVYYDLSSLGKISEKDGGEYNDSRGPGKGSDFLFAEYEKNNIKQYNMFKKYEEQVDKSTSLPEVNYDIDNFLALWKNETGKPDGSDYKKDGIVVEYDDVCGGKIAVGDMFENGGGFDLLDDLLRRGTNTTPLVAIFKFILYQYTGQDYGITDVSELENLFSLEPYQASDDYSIVSSGNI